MDQVADTTGPRRRGRPTEYDPAFCDAVILCGYEGKSLTVIAVDLGIARSTLYQWMKTHDEFSDAITRAREAALAYWQRVGREGLWAGRIFNAGVYKFIMRNQFPEDYGHRRRRGSDAQSQQIEVVHCRDE